MNDHLNGLVGREFDILNYIHKNGPITKTDLINKMGLKLTTLNRSMKLLESKKLIVESGISDSTGGRKPAEYDVTSDSIYTIGVDISRTYTQVVLMNLKMQILDRCRFDMESDTTPEKCSVKIADVIERMLSKLQIDKNMILGLGAGTVGPMNREDGILLHPQGFLNSAWNDNVPLKDLLQGKTSIPCQIDNGANTAILAEFLFGIGRGLNCVVYIHCGVGIRTAIIKDGLILRTMNDSEDAFAHITVDFNGALCKCGGKGCLESYVSLEAICRRYNAQTENNITYNELFERAAGNDDVAAEAFNYSAKILGIAISNLTKLMNPDLVILSGPLLSNYDPFYSICIKAFHEQNSLNKHLVFNKEGFFKKDVVAIGAGLMIIEQYFNEKRSVE